MNRLSVEQKSITSIDALTDGVQIGGTIPVYHSAFLGIGSDIITNIGFNQIWNLGTRDQIIISQDPVSLVKIILWGNRLINNSTGTTYILASGVSTFEYNFDGGAGASGGGAGSDDVSFDYDGGAGGSGTNGGPSAQNVYAGGDGFASSWLNVYTYPTGGNGGAGYSGNVAVGGTGGIGGNGYGGGGGGSATDSQGSGTYGLGGGGGGGTIAIIVNELIGNFALLASGGDSISGEAEQAPGGGGGGGVVLIIARKKQGTLTIDVSGGESIGNNTGFNGTAGSVLIYALRPDNTLEVKSASDNWDYLTKT
jgi:hypothetical protein